MVAQCMDTPADKRGLETVKLIFKKFPVLCIAAGLLKTLRYIDLYFLGLEFNDISNILNNFHKFGRADQSVY